MKKSTILAFLAFLIVFTHTHAASPALETVKGIGKFIIKAPNTKKFTGNSIRFEDDVIRAFPSGVSKSVFSNTLLMVSPIEMRAEYAYKAYVNLRTRTTRKYGSEGSKCLKCIDYLREIIARNKPGTKTYATLVGLSYLYFVEEDLGEELPYYKWGLTKDLSSEEIKEHSRHYNFLNEKFLLSDEEFLRSNQLKTMSSPLAICPGDVKENARETETKYPLDEDACGSLG